MANTYVAIATVTVGSGGAANIQFTNIPQTYTDLVVKLSPKTNRTDANYEGIVIALNSDATDGNYGSRWVGNDGSGAVSGTAPRYVGWTATNNGTAPNVFGNFELYFPNYASANKKSFAWDSVNEGNFASVVVQGLGAISWTSTNPITSISLTPVSANNLMQYSTATLYGIKNTV